MSTTIYHNPKCGTSRNVLAMIRATGDEPKVIQYLKKPPSSERIREIAQLAGVSIRELVRERGTPFHELGLDDPDVTEDDLLVAIAEHPILLNRPIVVTSKGAMLARPKEKLVSILENPLPEGFKI